MDQTSQDGEHYQHLEHALETTTEVGLDRERCCCGCGQHWDRVAQVDPGEAGIRAESGGHTKEPLDPDAGSQGETRSHRRIAQDLKAVEQKSDEDRDDNDPNGPQDPHQGDQPSDAFRRRVQKIRDRLLNVLMASHRQGDDHRQCEGPEQPSDVRAKPSASTVACRCQQESQRWSDAARGEPWSVVVGRSRHPGRNGTTRSGSAGACSMVETDHLGHGRKAIEAAPHPEVIESRPPWSIRRFGFSTSMPSRTLNFSPIPSNKMDTALILTRHNHPPHPTPISLKSGTL